MSLANSGYKGVFDSNIQPFAGKVIMYCRSLARCFLIKRHDRYVSEQSVYKGGFAAFLHTIKQFVNCDRSYAKRMFEVGLFKKSGAGLPLLQIINDNVSIYNDFGGFQFFQSFSSFFRGLSISSSSSAPSRERKSSVSLIKRIELSFTFTSTLWPFLMPSWLRRASGKVIKSFLLAFTVSIFSPLIKYNSILAEALSGCQYFETLEMQYQEI